LWQQAFATADPQEGKPRLRWQGDSDDQDVKTMQAGLLSFAPGVNMVIRNPATHVADDFTEQDGLEQLATLSVLAKFVDRCVVVSVDGVTASEAKQVLPSPLGEFDQVSIG
jgi:hypothetical protein